jgi:hypothetical protein
LTTNVAITARSIDRYYADVEVDIVFKDATSQALRTFLDGSNWALVTINAAVAIGLER